MSRGLGWPGFSGPLALLVDFSVLDAADSMIRLHCAVGICRPLDMVNAVHLPQHGGRAFAKQCIYVVCLQQQWRV